MDSRLSACWSLFLCWFNGFAAHSRQSACGLINGIASSEAVCGCNTCFSHKAPKNVFANSREPGVIHQLVSTFACAVAVICAVVQRAEKGFLLQRAECVLAWPRHIGTCCNCRAGHGEQQQQGGREMEFHGAILACFCSGEIKIVDR